MTFELLHPKTDRAKWMRVIGKLPAALQDVHWTPDYMAAEELRGHMPRLATYTYRDFVVAQPIIVRDVPETSYRDVSNPYGYGGPVSNHGQPQQLYAWFNESFTAWARENQVVTEFCALHPFMITHQSWMLKAVQHIGLKTRKQVVWVDLSGPDFEAGYHNNRVQGIRKARRNGIKMMVVGGGSATEFIRMYRAAMLRKQAAERWYFTDEYLKDLCRIGTVWYASLEGAVLSAGLMLLTKGGAAYYHLAANSDAYHEGANDLMVHEMAEFAAKQGCKRFHLGGGVTSDPNDPVLFFKSGFSDLRALALSYFRVFDEAAYEVLCAEKKRREVAETGAEFSTVFEPLYRREMA